MASLCELLRRAWESSSLRRPSPGRRPGTHLVGLPKVWDRVRQAAGLRDVRLHDLRHTYASFGVSQGMALPLVGSLLGHADVATTGRYAHLHDDPRRQAAEAISSKAQTALVTGSAPRKPAVSTRRGIPADDQGPTPERRRKGNLGYGPNARSPTLAA